MKTFLSLTLLGLLAGNATAADDAVSTVKAAAKKLAEKSNYSWTTTPKIEGTQRFRMGATEGKVEKDGWLHTKATLGDAEYETLRKGEKGAVKRDDEWRTLEEMESDDRGAFFARAIRGFKAPAVEAGEIAGTIKELKKGDGGLYSGDLTEEGAKTLLAFGGRRTPGPGFQNAQGTAKFWIKDGVLSKYEYTVSGSFKRPDNDEEVKRDRTVTVEIKDVGTTKVPVPEEVKKKLS